jgi:hypothetical protein
MYYSAAWTECGLLLGCSHEHETIVEADSCIPCASGYVVAVENGVMRSLTAEEETEWQRVNASAEEQSQHDQQNLKRTFLKHRDLLWFVTSNMIAATAITASRTRLWLASGWWISGRRLSKG